MKRYPVYKDSGIEWIGASDTCCMQSIWTSCQEERKHKSKYRGNKHMITDTTFFTCDQAAIKLIAYMELEQKSISIEKILRTAGYHEKRLYPRHLEKIFKAAVKEGKILRIQFKKLV